MIVSMMMMMTFETTHFTKGKSDSKCGNILTPYFTEYNLSMKKMFPLFGNPFAHNALYDYYYCCCKTLQQWPPPPTMLPTHDKCKNRILQFHIWQTTPLPAAEVKTSFLLI